MTDYLKWVPVLVLAASGLAGYVRTQTEVEQSREAIKSLHAALDKLEDETRDAQRSMWAVIGEIRREQ